jgi:hypothetical protein
MLCRICLFECIQMEGDEFMKYLKGAQSINIWEPLVYAQNIPRACASGNSATGVTCFNMVRAQYKQTFVELNSHYFILN